MMDWLYDLQARYDLIGATCPFPGPCPVRYGYTGPSWVKCHVTGSREEVPTGPDRSGIRRGICVGGHTASAINGGGDYKLSIFITTGPFNEVA